MKNKIINSVIILALAIFVCAFIFDYIIDGGWLSGFLTMIVGGISFLVIFICCILKLYINNKSDNFFRTYILPSIIIIPISLIIYFFCTLFMSFDLYESMPHFLITVLVSNIIFALIFRNKKLDFYILPFITSLLCTFIVFKL